MITGQRLKHWTNRQEREREKGKMKRLIVLSSLFVLLFGLAGAACAYTINYISAPDGSGGYKSPYSGVTIETFDLVGSPLWIWSGDYAFVTGSTGHNAAPYGSASPDSTKYVTVPSASSSGHATVANLGGTYNYFGIWWGSVDNYNTLTFFMNGLQVASFTGSEAINPSTANGNQTAPSTNLYVNFLDLPNFNSFKMSSSQYAFEADNIAVGNVPIPGAAWLLGSGLLGLLGFRRKFVG
jgi:hypothetical protein